MDQAATPPSLLAFTEIQIHPFLPEVRLHLARDAFGLWEHAEEAMGRGEVGPPFWASVWPGGLALARYLLQRPDIVRGRTVVDVATGSGVVAIAAAIAGARSVAAYDTDELAVYAAQMNSYLNGVSVAVSRADVRDVCTSSGALVLAGDVFYDRLISAAMLQGLTALSDAGAEVLIGDPYRLFLPQDRLDPITHFDIGVEMFLESDPVKSTLVARLCRQDHQS